MLGKNISMDIISRRMFFKKGVKVLPFILLAAKPIAMLASNGTTQDCKGQCAGTCMGVCLGTCRGCCKGSCGTACDGTCIGLNKSECNDSTKVLTDSIR